MSFDLRQFIRSNVVKSKERSPHILAKRIAMKIPEEHVRTSLAECLADSVRIEVTRIRMQAETPEVLSGAGERVEGPSRWKRQAHVARWIDQRENVNGTWKFRRECTAEDCDWLAVEHRGKKNKHARAEGLWTRAGALLRTNKAACLGDIAHLFGNEEGLAA